MLLSRSLRRKLLAVVLGSAGVMLLYQAVVIDSRSATDAEAPDRTARIEVIATAYCKGQTTTSGVAAQAGIAAADPAVLPEGSVVQVDGAPERERGIYTVLDTGPKVLGRHLDLYMWSCNEALAFGRRSVVLTVLRRGWNPNPSTSPTGPRKGD